LRDIEKLGRKKLYCLFDPGDHWLFEIRKSRSRKADFSLIPEHSIERIGSSSEQYPVFE